MRAVDQSANKAGNHFHPLFDISQLSFASVKFAIVLSLRFRIDRFDGICAPVEQERTEPK
jgi:hypothetical protein